ncbi:MAG: C-terminal binding protein [Dehalococcoidia bacterium]
MGTERKAERPWRVVFSQRLGRPLPWEEEALVAAGASVEVAPLWTEEEILRHATDADAFILGTVEPFNRRVIQGLSRCRVVSRRGVGIDNVDTAAATEEGIFVAYVPDASIAEVSDHALALLLALARRVLPLHQAIKAGLWRKDSTVVADTREPIERLSQQTLGMVGIGRIGLALAQKARPLGLRLQAYDPYVDPQVAAQHQIQLVGFEELLRECDLFSIHTPLTEATYHLFNDHAFSLMKPTAFLVNTARGELVDSQALYRALSQGRIAGAALDVTEQEPLPPDDPLLTLDNLFLTGHSAFYSRAAADDLRHRSVEAVVLAIQGRVPPHLANPEVCSRPNRRIPGDP